MCILLGPCSVILVRKRTFPFTPRTINSKQWIGNITKILLLKKDTELDRRSWQSYYHPQTTHTLSNKTKTRRTPYFRTNLLTCIVQSHPNLERNEQEHPTAKNLWLQQRQQHRRGSWQVAEDQSSPQRIGILWHLRWIPLRFR